MIQPLVIARNEMTKQSQRLLRSARNDDGGFTLIEVIVVVAVTAIIATIIVKSYSLFNIKVSLESDVGRVATALYRARADTIVGRGGLQYGVHFDSNKAVLFQGASYSSGASTNKNFPFSTRVSITSVSLSGGGNEVIFDKLTGTTVNFGTIKFGTSGVASATSTITISNNGIMTIK